MRLVCCWMLGLGLLSLPGLAHAQATAEALLQEGIVRFRLGKFRGSLEALARAEKAASAPAVLARINLYRGLNHAVTDHEARARASFRAALVQDPAVRLDPRKFKPSLTALLDKVRRGMRGELSVTGSSPGARVLVDGQVVGKTPYVGQVTIGRHVVQLRGADGRHHRREVIVAYRKRSRVEVKLGPPPVKASPPPASAPVHAGTPEVAAGSHHDSPPSSPRRRLWTWIAAGGAVAAAGVGIGLGASVYSDRDEFESLPAGDAGLDELEAAARDKTVAANVLFVAAGALAVTAVVLFFLEGKPVKAEGDRASVRLAPVVGQARGLLLTAEF